MMMISICEICNGEITINQTFVDMPSMFIKNYEGKSHRKCFERYNDGLDHVKNIDELEEDGFIDDLDLDIDFGI